MALRHIFDAIRPELESDCTVKFGSDALEEHDTAPKVTFVPAEFTFKMVEKQGLGGRSRHPRSLMTRRQAVDIHCWGEDSSSTDLSAQFAAAEELVERVIWAIHRAAHGSIEIGAGAPLENGTTDRGVVLVFRVFFSMPVVEPEDRRQLLAVTITDVSSAADVPEAGVPAAVTGVHGIEGSETEEEGVPAP